MNAEELFKFVKAQERMCGSFYNSCGDCDECELDEAGYCNPLSCNSVEKMQKLVSAVEKWAKEHPVKTRQTELLKLFPKTKFGDSEVVDICPEQFGYKPKRNEYGSCIESCWDCRRKFWLAEIEEEVMSKVKVNYTQTCDFCHKEKAVPIDGMFRIMLPGTFIGSDGSKHPGIVKGDICPDCLTRLQEYLSRQLVIEEIDHGGTHILWKDDVK